MINALRSALVSWALAVLVAWLIWSIVVALRTGEATVVGVRHRRGGEPLRFWLALASECALLVACGVLLVKAIRQV